MIWVETNQTVTTKQLNWDCLTRTLSVQRVWQAVLTQPRSFIPGSTATLPAGTVYAQDDFVVMRFNCNFTKGDGFYSIVYYREYFDNTQYVSTLTDLVSPVCPTTQQCPVVIPTPVLPNPPPVFPTSISSTTRTGTYRWRPAASN